MDVAVQEPVKSAQTKKHDTTKKQIRGSSLLLFGRFISVGLNFASQVLMVRHLSQADYGAFAYGLAVVAFFHGFSSLGLRRGITRFIPIYHEKKEYNKLAGTLVLTVGTIIVIGAIIISAIWISPEALARLIKDETQSVNLLLIMIFLVPITAFDELIIALFASFSNPKVIFFRKYIVAPVLKLSVVLLLIWLNSSARFLAYGYTTAMALGVVIFVGIFIRLLRREGLWQRMSLKTMNVPAKEIFAFTLPLLTSDLVTIVMHSADTMLLGFFHGTAQVAAYQVILPAAHFNKIPMMSFAILYTPLAARLFAQDDFKGINDLYLRTAIWMAVLSFPIFALTFSMAEPLTVMLYGARYESSWIFMTLFALGYYFNVALGFNGLTLKVLGKVKYVVILNVSAAVCSLLLAVILIPKLGALGATIASASTMIIHNIFKQAGLRMAADINIFNWRYFGYYWRIAENTPCYPNRWH
ncbi:flippase [bacterium]|nr:flippase [bacterium]